MDSARTLESDTEHGIGGEHLAGRRGAGAPEERMFDLGGDERRMHVRAYNHWVSLLKGRAFPSIADLEPATIADFGAHSVLIDFTSGLDDPRIAYLGRALRDECGLRGEIARIADVPPRSLLSRLTDQYQQILANRAPIGFEAEFIGARGRTTLYRGILMPFAAAGAERIDYIYGVINWKEVADPVVQAALDIELHAALAAESPAPAPMGERLRGGAEAAVWADGPHAAEGSGVVPAESLAEVLRLAQDSAAAVATADLRSRGALYRALGRAHDFGLAAERDPQALAALLAAAGLNPQARAPLTPIVKLVFGAGYDKTRLTEYAAVLGHARRLGVAEGRLGTFLEGAEGGIKAVVAAERDARRPIPTASVAAATLATRPALARVAMTVDAAPGEAVVLLARMGADGVLDVVHSHSDPKLAERLLVAKPSRRKGSDGRPRTA